MTESAADSNRLTYRDHSPLALLCIAAVYVVFTAILWWILDASEGGILSAVATGVLIGQPMLVGVWTALGAGSILTRLPVAIPCVAAQVIVLAYVPQRPTNMSRELLTASLVAALAIWALSTMIFVIIRLFTFTRLQIQSVVSSSHAEHAGFHFSIRYLLVLIALYAIGLGALTQIKFEPPPPPSGFSFTLGPSFLITVFAVGSAIIAAALLPTMAVPLAILHGRPSRRTIKWIIGLWIIITLLIVILTIDQENPLLTLGFLLLTQLTVTSVGAATAIALRYAGLRLTRTPRDGPTPSLSESSQY